MGGTVFPALLVIWSEASQHLTLQAVGWDQVLVSKWQPPGELTSMNIPLYLCHQCPCSHSEPQLLPASPGDPPRPAVRSGLGSCEFTALPLCRGVHETFCVPSKSGVSVSPSPVEFLWSSPMAFTAKCSGGSSSQCQAPRLGSLTWDAELLLLWEVLFPVWYNYFPVCGLPTWQVWDLTVSQMCPFYHLIVFSSLSLDVEQLFW